MASREGNGRECYVVLGVELCNGDIIRVALRGRGMIIVDGKVRTATPAMLVLETRSGIIAVRMIDVKLIEVPRRENGKEEQE